MSLAEIPPADLLTTDYWQDHCFDCHDVEIDLSDCRDESRMAADALRYYLQTNDSLISQREFPVDSLFQASGHTPGTIVYCAYEYVRPAGNDAASAHLLPPRTVRPRQQVVADEALNYRSSTLEYVYQPSWGVVMPPSRRQPNGLYLVSLDAGRADASRRDILDDMEAGIPNIAVGRTTHVQFGSDEPPALARINALHICYEPPRGTDPSIYELHPLPRGGVPFAFR